MSEEMSNHERKIFLDYLEAFNSKERIIIEGLLRWLIYRDESDINDLSKLMRKWSRKI